MRNINHSSKAILCFVCLLAAGLSSCSRSPYADVNLYSLSHSPTRNYSAFFRGQNGGGGATGSSDMVVSLSRYAYFSLAAEDEVAIFKQAYKVKFHWLSGKKLEIIYPYSAVFTKKIEACHGVKILYHPIANDSKELE